MKRVKVFESGSSHAVRLPEEFQFHSKDVETFTRDNNIVFHEKPSNLKHAFELLGSMPADFFSHGRQDTTPQKRNFF